MSNLIESSRPTSPSTDDEEYYPDHHWLSKLGIKRWKPHALPLSLNIDGKHVWEPPIFAYNDLIGDNYEKKREAVLKCTNGDRARATEFLDADIENDLLYWYTHWLVDNIDAARDLDAERASFFAGLLIEVEADGHETSGEYYKLKIGQRRNDDGTWRIWNRGDPAFDDNGNPIKSTEPSVPYNEEGAAREYNIDPANSESASPSSHQTDDEDEDQGQNTSHAQPLITEATPLLSESGGNEPLPHRLGRRTCCCIIQ